MSKISEFFEGANGQNSSKRLIGIIAGLVFCLLAFIGGLNFLEKNQSKEFQDLIESIAWFSGSLLGLGLGDIFLKRRYDSKSRS
jgi:hypothetical protein